MEVDEDSPAPTVNTSTSTIADAVLSRLFTWAPVEPKP
jgi:hypothetical protein